MRGSLAKRLDLPIASLGYPGRLRWVIEARGIETVRDLVALSPEQVASIPRCGRKTVLATDRAIRDLLGVSWREAHEATTSAGRAHLDTPLADVACPPRLKWLVAARGLHTVRELARLSPEDVLATRHCGPRTVDAVRDAVRAILGVEWERGRALARAPTPTREADWDATLRALIAALDAETAEVAARRLGARGAVEPVDAVASALGFSPRRTRRAELAAVERMRADPRVVAARVRLRAAVGAGAPRLAVLGDRDAFFRAAPARLESLAAFVDVVLAGPARTRRVGRDVLVSTLDVGDLGWRLQQLGDAVRRSAGIALSKELLADQLGWPRALARDLLALATSA